MQRMVLVLAVLFVTLLLCGVAVVYAQGQPTGTPDRPTPPGHAWPAPPEPDATHQFRGARTEARPMPPAAQRPNFAGMSMPADAQKAIQDAVARGGRVGERPHDPTGNGRSFRVPPKAGTPPGPQPPTGPRSEDAPAIAEDADPLSSLRLLHVGSQIQGSGGTACVIYANGGGASDQYGYRLVWGQGYQLCTSPYWIYAVTEQTYGFRCYFSVFGWCFPGANVYLDAQGSCQERYPYATQALWCSFAAYPNQGGYFYAENSGTVVATDGAAGDVVDSALFWVN